MNDLKPIRFNTSRVQVGGHGIQLNTDVSVNKIAEAV